VARRWLTELALWCVSRSAAILYGKEPGPGLISARAQCFVTQRSVYGVLSWRSTRNARHVSNRGGILRAINLVPIRAVEMACNTPGSPLERALCLLHVLPDGREGHGVQYATVWNRSTAGGTPTTVLASAPCRQRSMRLLP
jgi:hypothetical protein